MCQLLLHVSAPRCHYQGVYRQQRFAGPTHVILWRQWGRPAPEIQVGPMNLSCWWTPWWLHLGAKSCKIWHLIWSVFCDVLFCIVISAFCWFLKIWNYGIKFLGSNTVAGLRFPDIPKGPANHQEPLTTWHSITSQKARIFSDTTERIWNFTRKRYFWHLHSLLTRASLHLLPIMELMYDNVQSLYLTVSDARRD